MVQSAFTPPESRYARVLMPCRTDITSETIVRTSAQSQNEFATATLIRLSPRKPAMPAIGITARIRATRASNHAQARLLMRHLFGGHDVASVVPKFDILGQ